MNDFGDEKESSSNNIAGTTAKLHPESYCQEEFCCCHYECLNPTSHPPMLLALILGDNTFDWHNQEVSTALFLVALVFYLRSRVGSLIC